jgi:Mn2+/Fe2+ NRAMP family transporter
MNFAMVFAVVAVVAVALYARRTRGQDAPKSAARLGRYTLGIWVGLVGMLMLIFIVGTMLFGG